MNERVLKGTEVISRVCLGTVFGYAGALKLRDPQPFADSIHSFALIPNTWINPVALDLPVLEIFLGLLLLLGLRKRACACLAATLSIIFAVALAQALMRGLPVDCGCFGAGAASAWKTPLALARDIGLTALAIFVARHVTERNV
ncbi:MAG TPA: MauE/DoxX family redox-associated membrane protein [Rariglobus sp.]|jgi:uncharacterized membrane protein YphA (DoxX/SURF4 family)|nr:MauE/DoxX family redox-associated membrane protein [Rariglobus sp.]